MKLERKKHIASIGNVFEFENEENTNNKKL